MTPAERHQHFEDSVVTDLDAVPPAFLARVRATLEEDLAHRDLPNAS